MVKCSEIREILLAHGKRYPRMQAQDAVKLLYQSEFGGGHMVADPCGSLERLRGEWASEKEADRQSPACRGERSVLEEIGNGLCRVDLSVLDAGLAPETLNRMFVLTAEQTAGRSKEKIESFEKKLEVLRQCCGRGEMPFPREELERYLREYRNRGCPAVSHSGEYRKTYHPAYRVVADRYARYLDAFLRIDRLAAPSEEDRTVLVAIDGMCGGGKSTMARVLREVYDCRLFRMDDFFLRPCQRTEERLAQPGGNVDYERFRAEVLEHIGDRGGLRYRPFCCSDFSFGQAVETKWSRLNIVEGSYSQHPYFGGCYDLRFFCMVSEEEQLRRIRLRDGEAMLDMFRKKWIPMENRYFEAYKIREQSILVT